MSDVNWMIDDDKTWAGGSNFSAEKQFSLASGSFVAGRYQVVRQLGVGGMGQVYEVIDQELRGEHIALKVLHQALATESSVFDRFRNEVYVARSLSHPSLVRIFDLGRAPEGFYYVTMELVGGGSLKELIEDSFKKAANQVPAEAQLERIVSVLSQVLSAVSYAHKKGVIHRDLKPANILLANSDEVKIADFGTARLLTSDAHLTKTGLVVGTPAYMSPEQIRGQDPDGRCDLFSLGIVAYEYATGSRPFSADNSMAAMFRQVSEDVPPLRKARPDLPEWFETWVKRATERDREKRFQTAEEMLTALGQGDRVLKQTQVTDVLGSNKSAARLGVAAVLSCVVLFAVGYLLTNRFGAREKTENTLPAANLSADSGATPLPVATELPKPTPLVSDTASQEPIVNVLPVSPAPVPVSSPEASAEDKTAAVQAEIYFFRSGDTSPIDVFDTSEVDSMRWLAVLSSFDSQMAENSQFVFRVRHIQSGREENFSARILSFAGSEKAELRIGGNFSGDEQKARIFLVGGQFEAEFIYRDKVLASKRIIVK